ncbi:MAG: hypothetical protein RDU83_00460 [bacterium]|nr:hypothetical protein [bacterium]
MDATIAANAEFPATLMATDQHPADYTPAGARAATSFEHAGRLRHTAVSLRECAARIRHNPAMGQAPSDVSDLPYLLESADQLLRSVQRGADERARDQAEIGDTGGSTGGGPGAEAIRARHAAIEQAAQDAAAAVTVLRELLLSPGAAVLDSPYGRSAPLRHHPGALCAIIAERAESLAGALEAAAIIKANAAL